MTIQVVVVTQAYGDQFEVRYMAGGLKVLLCSVKAFCYVEYIIYYQL